MTVTELLALSDSGTIGIRVRWGTGEETAIWVDSALAANDVIARKTQAKDTIIAAQVAARAIVPVPPSDADVLSDALFAAERLAAARKTLDERGLIEKIELDGDPVAATVADLRSKLTTAKESAKNAVVAEGLEK
jgi:hypothetical protein